MKHRLIQEFDNILVAVSGGPDSMAMLGYFQEIQQKMSIDIHVAHVDHGLRGSESKEEADFVRSYCKERSIEFYLHEPNVVARKQTEGLSTQQAARASRYEWFDTLMKKLKTNKLAFAHHGDDQIETMLMRQIRGSLSGRKGIPVKRDLSFGQLIRPFLCVEKKALLAYCYKQNIPYRSDSSNDENRYQRNRIRHELLPFIKSENPKAHELFQYQSEVWTEEEMYLELEAKKHVSGVILSENSDEMTLSNRLFTNIPKALQRRVLHLILNYLGKNDLHQSPIDHQHLESVLAFMTKKHPSGSLDLPNILVEKVYEKTIISTNNALKRSRSLEPQQLKIPSIVNLPKGRLEITKQLDENQPQADNYHSRLLLDLEKLKLPLKVRSRHEGDKMSFIGSKGTKKIKDLFIEKKIPKRDRDSWPIVTDSHGTILWVPFLKRSNEAVVDQTSTNIIQLTYGVKK